MEEEWREVIDYEGIYQVSNLGNVRSIDRVINNRLFKGILLKPRYKENKEGSYLTVNLKRNSKGKTKFVHRLVAEAFIPNVCNYPFVNHINEIKTDNRVENLEWCTSQYNANYSQRNEKIMKSRISSGYVNPLNIGLTREEYMKMYRQKYNEEHKEEMKIYQHNYYLTKKKNEN